MKQKRFTREVEEEAVRLYRTSGRTRLQIAEDIGIGLSRLTRWLSRSQERDILNRAKAFFAKDRLRPECHRFERWAEG